MKPEPGPHPEPPSDFHSRTRPIATHGGSLYRTHLCSPEGDMRSNLAAILDLYGFNIVETEMRPDKKHPGTAGESGQGNLFEE